MLSRLCVEAAIPPAAAETLLIFGTFTGSFARTRAGAVETEAMGWSQLSCITTGAKGSVGI